MPVTDQLHDAAELDEDEHIAVLGADPGEADTWEIIRVSCPECARPIALIGDEERLPQHAVLPTAWHPFSAATCAGSGVPTDDLTVCDAEADATAPGLEALLALPAGLDWRTQPFSHPSCPGGTPARVPAQHRRLVRR